ncbi:phenylalanine--tRNA ligase beta subunit-related protein [Metabacillus sp. FJAT-52054]|uniref:Phenylalanine--tRNA ligase beta subunit-related protein n=1 Tax=Metabacillus sediminis TaxID=3117746 RepID=A0ABZ2NIZ5_9BACI
MEITVNHELKELEPSFKIGIALYRGIEVGDSPQMLKGRMRLFQESLYFDFENQEIKDIPAVQEWRALFKKAGTDPNRYRPAQEAIFRRIKKQQYLETIHSAADINNFFSMEYQIPIGIYDLDRLNGNIEIRIGNSDDTYEAINGREVSMEKKILSADGNGAFGSPYVDSKKTAASRETVNALQIVYLAPSMEEPEAEKLLSALTSMFVQIHGGTEEHFILS